MTSRVTVAILLIGLLGFDDYLGVAVYIEGHQQNPFSYRPAADTTGLQDFGTLTAATLLQGLLPLVIVLLACGAFAAEREQGTLRQLLSLGTPAWALFWGKAAGLAAGLAVLTPRPRVNLILYYGVLAPRAAWRAAVVPGAWQDGVGSDRADSVETEEDAACAKPSRGGGYRPPAPAASARAAG